MSVGTGRRYFSFDVFVNGKKIDSLDNFSNVELPADYASMQLPLGEFEKRYLKKEQASLSKQMNGLAVAGKDNEAAEIAKLYNELTNLLGEESL